MAKKLDRRVRRTRKLLCDAMLALILEQDYETITIQDITERADLNRATFYLHYGSREELLTAALEAQFDKVVAKIEAHESDLPFWEETADLQFLFEHVEENAELYEILFGKNGMGYIINRVIDQLTAYGIEHWHGIFNEADVDISTLNSMDMICCRWIAGAIYGVMSWWVLNGRPYSIPHMTEITHKLIQNGAKPIVMDVIMNANT